jgi:hypothetical protein
MTTDLNTADEARLMVGLSIKKYYDSCSTDEQMSATGAIIKKEIDADHAIHL